MNYWALFRQSWSILWRNRTLWVFGLLATLGGGGLSYRFNLADVRPVAELPLGARELLRSILGSGDIATLAGIALAIGVITFALATFGQAALIGLVDDVAGGQSVTVGEGVRAGWRHFVPLLIVRVLLALPVLVVGALAAGSFLPAFTDMLNAPGEKPFGLGALGAFTLLGALSFVIALLTWAVGISAERAVVLDELSPWPAIVRGWNWLWAKFADYFSISLIFLVLAILVGIVFVCALLPVLVGTVVASVDQLRSGNVFVFTTAIVGPAVILLLVLGLIAGSLASVFVSSVWTLAYRGWRAAAPIAGLPGSQSE